MKHSIRQRIINEYGLPVVKVEQVTGELGSGITDKNGNEIFEGDIVKSGRTEATDSVRFIDGHFSAGSISLKYDSPEVVGHVADAK